MPSLSFTQGSAAGGIDVKHSFEVNGVVHQLWLSPCQRGYRLSLSDKIIAPVAFSQEGDGGGVLSIAGESESVRFLVDGGTIHVHIGGRTRLLRYIEPLGAPATACEEEADLVARAPMPGVVVATKVFSGQAVSTGTPLIVMESMKLETVIRSPRSGLVERIHFKEGESFDRDAVLVTLSEHRS
jgi:acetyl/propionyl-CoA carboxylase alpha subunit